MQLTETNFSTSSIKSTGALNHSTADHSVQFRGVIANNFWERKDHEHLTAEKLPATQLTVKNGIYKIATWRIMLSAMAPTRYILLQMGSFNKLSFSESEFIALNISTVTRIDKLIVVARCDITFVNISQPISGKWLVADYTVDR